MDRNATLTYSQLVEVTGATLLSFRSLGIRPGTIVAACGPNLNELTVAFLAVQRLGGVWVGINRALSVREKIAQLRDCGAVLFLGDEPSIAQIESERPQLPELTGLLLLSQSVGQLWGASRGHENPVVRYPLPDPLAPAAIAYTSGTTGIPKGTVHSQHSMMVFVNGRLSSGEGGQWTRGYRRGISIPLTILNCMLFGPIAALAGGGSFVAMDRTDAAGVGEWIQSRRVEVFNGAPPTMRDLLLKPELRHFDLSSLRAVALGGGAIPEGLFVAFRDRFDFELVADYGLTESPASVVSSLINEKPRPGSPGKANHHLEVAIMSPTGDRLPTGEVGELCVGAASNGEWAGVYTGMLGYWRKPDETRGAFHGPWLRTGDLASVAEDGVISIVGRRKEMILRGGANVYPAEVESVLRLDERVEDVVVMGLPDERLGEIVVAYLKLRPGEVHGGSLLAELRHSCAEQLARYKIPERWFVVDDFPRNAMNKPVRKLIPSHPATDLSRP
jgi:acyl-CoA synthetase (AMP-forming)/AMP-acid ligase II